jgi:hypothetical protein
MFGTLIWPLAFAAMDKATAAAFRAWPHVETISDVSVTAIAADHGWPQNLDSGTAAILTMKVHRPSEQRRSSASAGKRRDAFPLYLEGGRCSARDKGYVPKSFLSQRSSRPA